MGVQGTALRSLMLDVLKATVCGPPIPIVPQGGGATGAFRRHQHVGRHMAAIVAFQIRGLGKYEKMRKTAMAMLTSSRRVDAVRSFRPRHVAAD
jgi:hypothetical protein